MYRLQLSWDILFAVLLAVPMVAVLDAVWATSLDDQSPFRILVFLPVVYVIVDVIEDVLLLSITSRVRFKKATEAEQQGGATDPCADVDVLGLGSLIPAQVATALKFLAVGASLALIIAGGVKHVVECSPAILAAW